MKKFLVLYNSTRSAMEQMASATPEQAKAGMDAWMTWATKAGNAVVDLGSPVGNGVKQSGPDRTASSDSTVAGFSILKAESRDRVVDLIRKHPHVQVPGNSIEVLEFLPMPGM